MSSLPYIPKSKLLDLFWRVFHQRRRPLHCLLTPSVGVLVHRAGQSFQADRPSQSFPFSLSLSLGSGEESRLTCRPVPALEVSRRPSVTCSRPLRPPPHPLAATGTRLITAAASLPDSALPAPIPSAAMGRGSNAGVGCHSARPALPCHHRCCRLTGPPCPPGRAERASPIAHAARRSTTSHCPPCFLAQVEVSDSLNLS
ncbi:hypothetical protein NL676_010821 [Syzygium grande]|nr:hypothetical protein NL676_010821 [Syzygium grande]